MSTFRRAVAVVAAVAACASGATACDSTETADGRQLTIALLLPESQTRYTSFDKPAFERRVAELCGSRDSCRVVYENANQDTAKQQRDLDAALVADPDVIVLDPVNGETAGALVAAAKAKRIPVVAYDRLIGNADLDAYVAFDARAVGRAQAQALLDKLKADGRPTGKIVMLNGATTDADARLLNEGADEVFGKAVGYEIVPKPDLFVPGGKPETARAEMAAQISRLSADGFVGVYSATDGMTGGAIAAMRANGVRLIPPITGHGSELAAIQRILAGEQYMTVYESYRSEAERAAEIAMALAKGEQADGLGATTNNGAKEVPTALVPVVALTRGNLKSTVVADNLWRVEQICTPEFAARCAAAGLR